jgi:hypothetical protein
MGALLSGREVIVVGAVTNKDNHPQYGMTISMDTFAMIELGGEEITEEVFEPQQTLPKQTEEGKKDDTDGEGTPIDNTQIESETRTDNDAKQQNNKTHGTTKKTAKRSTTTDEPTSGAISIEEVKKKLLWKVGVMSGKKTIEEQKQYLRGLKFDEDIIDKLKFNDWVVVTAKQQGIDVDNDVAIGLIKVAYEEITGVSQ